MTGHHRDPIETVDDDLQPDFGVHRDRGPHRFRARRSSARTRTSSWSARSATPRQPRPPCSAASTGHLVFSTLHTNDAASSVTRLIDLGIAAVLDFLGSDRRRWCSAWTEDLHRCKAPPADAEEAAMLSLQALRGSGSSRRKGLAARAAETRATFGRTGIFELLAVDLSSVT